VIASETKCTIQLNSEPTETSCPRFGTSCWSPTSSWLPSPVQLITISYWPTSCHHKPQLVQCTIVHVHWISDRRAEMYAGCVSNC